MSCGGSERIRGSKLMSLAPALFTQHAAQRLMGSLAGRRGGGGGGVGVRACVYVHGPSGQAKGNFVNAE